MRSTTTILALISVATLAVPAAARGPMPIATDPAPDVAADPDVVVAPEPDKIAVPLPPDPLDPLEPSFPPDVIATPPPVDPPPPDHEVPRSSLILIGSALTARMPEGAGTLSDLGRGAALTLGWVQRRADVPTGVMVRGMAVGNDGTRIYSLDVQLIASARIGRRLVVPFVGIGLAFGSARFAATEKQMAGSTMALGPVGGLGLHGFLGDAVYWRAELSAIGAGAAVVLGGVSLGWVFGS